MVVVAFKIAGSRVAQQPDVISHLRFVQVVQLRQLSRVKADSFNEQTEASLIGEVLCFEKRAL